MFNNLEEYYNYIELNVDADINISDFIQLRNKTEDEEIKRLCNYEIYMHDFNIIRNILGPVYSFQNQNGKQEYPNLGLFDDNLQHLKFRATKIINPRLKAKYNHILWLHQKHIDFAKVAIDNYLVYLKHLPNADIQTSEFYAEAFENLFLLSQQVSYKKEEVLRYFLSMLRTEKMPPYQEYSVMKCIVSDGKKIRDTLEAFYEYINEIITQKGNRDFIKEYLKLQLIIAQKIDKRLAPFHNSLAEFYVEKSKSHQGTFVVHIYYSKAMNQYKKAGNKEKMEEISVLIEKAKSTLGLKSQKFEFSNTNIDKYLKKVESHIENLINNYDSMVLYEHLILCPDIFPKAELLNQDINTPLMELVNVIKFDQNRNITNKAGSAFNMYNLYLKTISQHHLATFFQQSFISDKLSFETISEYILNNTWYGYDVDYNNPDGTKIPFKWAQLILPSLQSFFIQTKTDFTLNKYNHQAYILCIDSLTIKFEGLLREFSRRIDAQTIEIKEDSIEERISIEKLLENKKIADLVSEDDIALFKYIFTNEGMNLRNNIAHCFYKPTDYRIDMMWLLIVAILKLGNFKYTDC